MLPDPVKMIADVPGALRVSALDAVGASHDAVLTQTEFAPQATEYGITFAGGGDTLFVAKPFAVPKDEKVTYTDAGGASHTRRADSTTDNVIFLAITLGEEC